MNQKIKHPTDEEYSKERLRLLVEHGPKIYACKKCGWPVIKGYCCYTCKDRSPNDTEPDPYEQSEYV